LFDGRFRGGVDRAVKPVGGALTKTGLSPDHLTALGMLLAVPAAVVIGSGHTLIGFFLLMFAAVPDLLDGALAKASGRSSVRGAFFDSVSDRVTDILILGGVAWYLQDRYHGHAFALPLAILGASLLISYQRAKAESLGFDAKGGLMERAERVVVLCAGLAFGFLLVPLLWVMLALTLVTAVQRFVKVWRQATAAGLRAAAGTDAGPAVTGKAVGLDEGGLDEGRPAEDGPSGDRPSGEAASPAAVEEPDGERGGRPGAPVLPELAVAARWRAWREANGWAPRHPHYSPGAAQAGAADRWRERRRARLEAEGRPVARRRSGTRRP
jgi:CDP-diacylglycerol---glycerol-3-phosphate 3-phosphatidyltransferase